MDSWGGGGGVRFTWFDCKPFFYSKQFAKLLTT